MERTVFTSEQICKRFKLNIEDAEHSSLYWDSFEGIEKESDFCWKADIYKFSSGHLFMEIDNPDEDKMMKIMITPTRNILGKGSMIYKESIIELYNYILNDRTNS